MLSALVKHARLPQPAPTDNVSGRYRKVGLGPAGYIPTCRSHALYCTVLVITELVISAAQRTRTITRGNCTVVLRQYIANPTSVLRCSITSTHLQELASSKDRCMDIFLLGGGSFVGCAGLRAVSLLSGLSIGRYSYRCRCVNCVPGPGTFKEGGFARGYPRHLLYGVHPVGRRVPPARPRPAGRAPPRPRPVSQCTPGVLYEYSDLETHLWRTRNIRNILLAPTAVLVQYLLYLPCSTYPLLE